MFCDTQHRVLASMSATDWNELGVSELPTGTVTLLLADVEGSTRLWQTQPDEMAAAVARLELLHDREVVCHAPSFDGLTVFKAQDAEGRYIDCPTGWRYAPKLTAMRSCAAPVGNSERTLGDDEVQWVAVVREGCTHHLNACSVPGATVSLKTRRIGVIDEVLGDELVDEI
jgi:class 3 adenylate cyclase